MPSSQKFSRFKSNLMTEKSNLEKYLKQNDSFGLSRGHFHESMGELSSYDNHPADEGTELYEREKDIALEEHYKLELANIDHALKALENGTYGKCEVCGQMIPIERLEVIPTTTFCIEHSPDQHLSHDRPIEEKVLEHPFGQFDYDNRDESVAYDAEDTWQEVAEWGTSETPSDMLGDHAHYNGMYIESDENIGYVEDFENFVGTDLYGKNITVFPNAQHEKYEQALDDEGIMTTFGDLPPYEREPYVSDKED